MPYDFDTATAVSLSRLPPIDSAAEPTRYEADLQPSWSIAGALNGGYLLAILARAATAGDPAHPDPAAVSATYLRPPRPGAANVEVQPLAVGRTLATRRAALVQDGRTLLVSTVTAGRLPGPDQAATWDDAPAPDGPGPDDCVRAGRSMPGMSVPLMDHVDLRVDPADAGFALGRPSGRASVRGFLRLADGREPDPLSLLLAVDALPPAVFGLGGQFGWTPTVELTVHVRARPAPGWVQVTCRTRRVAGGFLDEQAMAWDSAGTLVAQSHQLALVGKVG